MNEKTKVEATGYDSAGMKIKHVMRVETIFEARERFARAHPNSKRPGVVEVVQVGPIKSESLP